MESIPGIITETENRFTYHKPIGNQPQRYEFIRNGMKALAQVVERLCPESRERALAITKLEEASMWANASIARNEDDASCNVPFPQAGLKAAADEQRDKAAHTSRMNAVVAALMRMGITLNQNQLEELYNVLK